MRSGKPPCSTKLEEVGTGFQTGCGYKNYRFLRWTHAIMLAGKIWLLFTFMLPIFFSCLISVFSGSAAICKVSVESGNTDLTNMTAS